LKTTPEKIGYPYINNRFVAFNSVCTHLSCVIELPNNDTSVCPCHGAIFSVVDGTVLGGPAPRPLPAIKLEIDQVSGDIYATELIGKIGYGRE
jgi:Rieske Fe-S protein